MKTLPILTLLVIVSFLFGCASLTPSQQAQADTAVANVANIALPLVAEAGIIAGQTYVNQQAAQGKISPAEATALNQAIVQVAGTLQPIAATQKDLSTFWTSPQTRAKVLSIVSKTLGRKV